jgi:UPF0755 protein
MIKKVLIIFILFLLILGGVGIYGALKFRDQIRQERLTAKAPQASVTFLEGWSNNNIADYLQKQGITSSADFLLSLKNFNTAAYQNILPKEADGSLEGFIFPDTYFIPQNPPAGRNIGDVIITKALDNFTQKITPQMLSQAQSQGMSLYQIITLASIIEKESGGNQDDRKMIAGVFYNRLKAGMSLESDATVSFAVGHSPITTADTQIDSPYNTYKYKGLPPGPICNPGLNSIMAALYPTASNYLYFLTVPQTGRAVFAQTYDEHLANKQKYLSH